MQELSLEYGFSIRTIQHHFDNLNLPNPKICLPNNSINLLFDTTFFSRRDGVLVFRANSENLHWRFVESETVKVISEGLTFLEHAGYCFKSITIDGRKGVIQLLNTRYPGIPIQLCQFHQAQIIRRYTTNNPKTNCGRDLKALMSCLTEVNYKLFASMLAVLQDQYADFLKERNE